MRVAWQRLGECQTAHVRPNNLIGAPLDFLGFGKRGGNWG
jgi:hypothetical protein